MKRIGIIGAMDIEIDAIVAEMENKTEKIISSIKYVDGTLNGVPCVVAKCSAGKVNAAICAETMILSYDPRLIINVGVAGGIGDGVEIGDFVIAESCVQHDYDTTALNGPESRGKVWGIELVNIPCDENTANTILICAKDIYGRAYKGVVATGDQFIADPDKCLALREDFGALACEMEGAAIAHACYMNGIPVAVLRGISDNANHSETVDYEEFSKSSAKKSQELLKRVITKL